MKEVILNQTHLKVQHFPPLPEKCLLQQNFKVKKWAKFILGVVNVVTPRINLAH